ncbi:MAG: beta-propeller fold lactonase family protein [Kiritimatiellae bacterium]|nr:beta-propeller fold lactonase family protein [Kiritimatiellia bacterium]
MRQTAARVFKTAPAGAGPRHLLFHPNGRLAFLVSELGNLVSSLAWDRENGFRALDALSTTPRAPIVSPPHSASRPTASASSSRTVGRIRLSSTTLTNRRANSHSDRARFFPARGRATSSSSRTRSRSSRWSARAKSMRCTMTMRPARSRASRLWAASSAPSR